MTPVYMILTDVDPLSPPLVKPTTTTDKPKILNVLNVKVNLPTMMDKLLILCTLPPVPLVKEVTIKTKTE